MSVYILVNENNSCVPQYFIPVQGSRVPVVAAAKDIGSDHGGSIFPFLAGDGGQGSVGQRTLRWLRVWNPTRIVMYVCMYVCSSTPRRCKYQNAT